LDRATALELLNRGASDVKHGELAIMQNGLYQFVHADGDCLFENPITVLREWLGAAPGPDQVVVAWVPSRWCA
jgi:hypothetical protein